MSTRKVILYISMSLDGYIATNDDNIDWLSIAEQEGEDYGYSEFVNQVDTYIVGRKTYDVVTRLLDGAFPQAEQFECYVITRGEIPKGGRLQSYNGDLGLLVTELKSKPGKDIYCDGGSEIVLQLMKQNLIDEYVIPTILGDGKRLFKGGIESIHLEALPARHFPSGVTQLRYRKK